MKRLVWFSVFCLAFVFTSCDDSSKRISKSDFGDAWPFEVTSGTISCEGDPYIIIFESGGRVYGLNDAARATDKYEEISVIIKTDDNYPGGQVKMDISVIEFEGLKLCNHHRE